MHQNNVLLKFSSSTDLSSFPVFFIASIYVVADVSSLPASSISCVFFFLARSPKVRKKYIYLNLLVSLFLN